MQTLYTVWIILKVDNAWKKPDMIPWRKIAWDLPYRREKTLRDIVRHYPLVDHIIVRDRESNQVMYMRYEGAGSWKEVNKRAQYRR